MKLLFLLISLSFPCHAQTVRQNGISSTNITASSVNAVNVQPGVLGPAVIASSIAANVIVAGNFQSQSVNASAIASNAVTSTKIGSGAVLNSKLLAGADYSNINSLSAVTSGIVASTGVFTSTLTVQGNAFSVGGSTFVVNGGNVGIGTANPRANLDVSVAGSTWAAIFTPNLSSFTVSSALSGTYTNTTLTTCITGSTMTITLPGGVGQIFVGFNGTASVGSLNAVMGAGIIVDGGYVNGETASKGLTAPQETVATDGTNLSFSTLLTGLSAGAHNVCLSLFVSAGTGTIDSTNSVAKLWMYALP